MPSQLYTLLLVLSCQLQVYPEGSSVTWQLGAPGADCHGICSAIGGSCTEHLWPTSLVEFEFVIAMTGFVCQEIRPGTWDANPVSDGARCWWNGTGSSRCRNSYPGVARICPCQVGYVFTGVGIAGPNEIWDIAPPGDGVLACHQAVIADARCSKEYFTYVERGDQRCGCKGSSQSISVRHDPSSDFYNIQVTTNYTMQASICGGSTGLNNFTSQATMEENGWVFNWHDENSFRPASVYTGMLAGSYFGFRSPGVGAVSLTLQGSGNLSLSYGNAWWEAAGVGVYLNGILHDQTEPSVPYKVTNVQFKQGDVLKIEEIESASSSAIIVINSITFACEECEDKLYYVDAKGYRCREWAGFNCLRAVDDYSYTQQEEDHLVGNCTLSCGVCKDYASARWHWGVPSGNCHGVCSSFGLSCIESLWPDSQSDFHYILDWMGQTCTSVFEGTWTGNPVTDGSKCWWKGGGTNRCSTSLIGVSRLCPCQAADCNTCAQQFFDDGGCVPTQAGDFMLAGQILLPVCWPCRRYVLDYCLTHVLTTTTTVTTTTKDDRQWFAGYCRYDADNRLWMREINVSDSRACQKSCEQLTQCTAYAFEEDDPDLDCDLYEGGPYTYGDGRPNTKCFLLQTTTTTTATSTSTTTTTTKTQASYHRLHHHWNTHCQPSATWKGTVSRQQCADMCIEYPFFVHGTEGNNSCKCATCGDGMISDTSGLVLYKYEVSPGWKLGNSHGLDSCDAVCHSSGLRCDASANRAKILQQLTSQAGIQDLVKNEFGLVCNSSVGANIGDLTGAPTIVMDSMRCFYQFAPEEQGYQASKQDFSCEAFYAGSPRICWCSEVNYHQVHQGHDFCKTSADFSHEVVNAGFPAAWFVMNGNGICNIGRTGGVRKCADICAAIPECKFFSVSTTQSCYACFIYKSCESPIPAGTAAYQIYQLAKADAFLGYCRYGKDERDWIRDIRVVDSGSCKETCQRQFGCSAYAFDEETLGANCDLYSGGPYTHGTGRPKTTCYLSQALRSITSTSAATTTTVSARMNLAAGQVMSTVASSQNSLLQAAKDLEVTIFHPALWKETQEAHMAVKVVPLPDPATVGNISLTISHAFHSRGNVTHAHIPISALHAIHRSFQDSGDSTTDPLAFLMTSMKDGSVLMQSGATGPNGGIIDLATQPILLKIYRQKSGTQVHVSGLTEPILVTIMSYRPTITDASGVIMQAFCAYWHETSESWRTDGVNTLEGPNGELQCSTTHLTMFSAVYEHKEVISAPTSAPTPAPTPLPTPAPTPLPTPAPTSGVPLAVSCIDRQFGQYCQNGGVVSGQADNCSCSCAKGYRGGNCEKADDCVTGADGNACQNGGMATGQTGTCGCSCIAGYSGANCQTADDCTIGANEKSCQNAGMVTGKTGDCRCSCRTGYSGANCQTVLDCPAGAQGHVCQNGGVATGRTGNCGCSCTKGYSGAYCQTADACTQGADGKACQHGGTVIGTTGNCGCSCRAGYSGANCQTADKCTTGSDGRACENGGKPKGKTGNCACSCAQFFTGEFCETVILTCMRLAQPAVFNGIMPDGYNLPDQPQRGTRAQCAQLCLNVLDCAAFSWPSGANHTLANDCYLKKLWDREQVLPSGWLTVQLRDCKADACVDLNASRQHQGYMPNYYSLPNQPTRGTQSQCSKLCFADMNCSGFSWPAGARGTSVQECYLKRNWDASIAKYSGWETVQVRDCRAAQSTTKPASDNSLSTIAIGLIVGSSVCVLLAFVVTIYSLCRRRSRRKRKVGAEERTITSVVPADSYRVHEFPLRLEDVEEDALN